MGNPNCPKCHGEGFVKEKDGSIHTCWDCLQDGGMDQHSSQVKDAGIKI
jgi:DnaJ-class molecular chaperone